MTQPVGSGPGRAKEATAAFSYFAFATDTIGEENTNYLICSERTPVQVGFSGSENEVDLQGFRRRLRKMKDQELRRFELAAQFMSSSGANQGQPPSQALVIQLEEARAEVERRKTAEPPCKDKEKYGSEAEALMVATYQAGTDKAGTPRAHKCPDCGSWHLTKQV